MASPEELRGDFLLVHLLEVAWRLLGLSWDRAALEVVEVDVSICHIPAS